MAVKSRLSDFVSGLSGKYSAAEASMAETVRVRATMLAPVDTGALRESGRVDKLPGGGHRVTFGGGDVPYARIHELGGVTGRNYATRIVAKHYLKRAGDSVQKEPVTRYIK